MSYFFPQCICMYIFLLRGGGGDSGGDTFKIPSPYEQFLHLPIHPLLSCFRRDSLMTHHCLLQTSFTVASLPIHHLSTSSPPKKKFLILHELGIFFMSSFSNLEYDYRVFLRNSLLNGDNLENDKPTIRKSQSYRFYVYYKTR